MNVQFNKSVICDSKGIIKNRRNSEPKVDFDTKHHLKLSPHKMKRNAFNVYSEAFDFLDENDYEEGLMHTPDDETYVSMNDPEYLHPHVENSEFLTDNVEEYNINIDNIENYSIENTRFFQNSSLNSTKFYNSDFLPSLPITKRKHGIVGRPTLSSPHGILKPDNVYCFNNDKNKTNNEDNYYGNNIHRINHSKFKKPILKRKCPQFILKPPLNYNCNNVHNYINLVEQDAEELKVKKLANIEFVRNLVARAERHGTHVDKKKFPQSMFNEDSEDFLQPTTSHLISEVVRMRESEPPVTFPYGVNGTESSKPGTFIDNSKHKIPQSASDILKQRRIESCQLAYKRL